MDRSLTQQDRNTLLELARSALEARLEDRCLPDLDAPDGPLLEHRGAFVTLSIGGQLRGCIGFVEGIQPLWKTVRDTAISAGWRDPRFEPLTADELDQLEIEISVLSTLERMEDPLKIQVGVHGLLIECGRRRGLLLPQVAERFEWDTVTFLDRTCRKAGLDSGCWRSSEATVYSFTAEHFSEDRVI